MNKSAAAGGTFATALNCIDGRAQKPVIRYVKEKYHVDHVDMITYPGMDKALSHSSAGILAHLKQSAEISVKAHHSQVIVIAGHYDCAANPVSEAQHKKDIIEAIKVVKSWKLPVRVTGLWINSHWTAEPVSD